MGGAACSNFHSFFLLLASLMNIAFKNAALFRHVCVYAL